MARVCETEGETKEGEVVVAKSLAQSSKLMVGAAVEGDGVDKKESDTTSHRNLVILKRKREVGRKEKEVARENENS